MKKYKCINSNLEFVEGNIYEPIYEIGGFVKFKIFSREYLFDTILLNKRFIIATFKYGK
jgi:hypothetical protein